ncbi:MAG TPA: glycosyltransferase family 39 protein [Phycisphaerae bacterium]|nr:glycosyltransferase family 39 protein [Phycisphaerae bacterium]
MKAMQWDACTADDTRKPRSGAALRLLGVLFIAALLRLPGLDRWPPPLYQDEASRLYDAWCLLETGGDRHGARWPLMLESFGEGDYTAALTTYLTIPFVAVLGPTETAARLPDALLGVATVALLYFLVRRLSGEAAAVIAAIVLATDPWHLLLCRTAHESGFAPFFLALALLATASAGLLRESGETAQTGGTMFRRCAWAILAGLAFGLHTWIYPATRVFTPLFLVALLLVFARSWRWRLDRTNDGAPITAALAGLAIGTMPLWITALSDASRIAARSRVAIWAQPPEIVDSPSLKFVQNELSNLSPLYYFYRSDELSGATLEGIGLHLVVTAPLWIAGLVLTVRTLRRSRWSRLLLAWLLLYPGPAALCADWNPHPFRTISGMLLYPILAGIGGAFLIRHVPAVRQRVVIICASTAMACNLVYFVDVYVSNLQPRLEAGYQTGLVRAMRFVGGNMNDADFVLVTREFVQPYIYALLYAPIEPASLQALPKISGPDRLGFHQFIQLGKFFFPPRDPLTRPELTAQFNKALESLPQGAVGLVIELEGAFPEGQVIATFPNGTRKPVEVRRWRRSAVASAAPAD